MFQLCPYKKHFSSKQMILIILKVMAPTFVKAAFFPLCAWSRPKTIPTPREPLVLLEFKANYYPSGSDGSQCKSSGEFFKIIQLEFTLLFEPEYIAGNEC